MTTDSFDVLIVGAGVSGIGVACTLAAECPDKTFAILETPRAPGTAPWRPCSTTRACVPTRTCSRTATASGPGGHLQVLASGTAIRDYLADTVREFGVDRHIRYGLKIVSADWSSTRQQWTVTAVDEASGALAPVAMRPNWCWAPATTTTTTASRRGFPASSASPARWSIRSTGRRISSSTASAS